MKAYSAIVKLTLRNAVRSHVFQLLLLFLILCVGLVPTTVGGGTATDFIRVSLSYSLWGVGAILSLSALWVGCHVMSADIDSYQLHMVVAKPVSRVTVWLAKWTGVVLLHLFLLGLSAAAIYGVVTWRFDHGNFPAAERDRIRSEVLVGRRVFLPRQPDYQELAQELAKQKILDRQKRGVVLDLSPKAQERILKSCLKEVMTQASEIPPGRQRAWVYENVPRHSDKPLFLRYRPYVGRVSSERQRMTRVHWFVGVPRPRKGDAGNDGNDTGREEAGKREYFMYPMTPRPEQLMSGEFHELRLRGEWGVVTPDNEVMICVFNADPAQANHYYQPADGPKILIEVTGFLGNYLRGVLVLAMQIILMAALSCAFGGFLTLPTAVFVTSSYLLFGAISVFMTDRDYYVNGATDRVGQFVARWLLKVVIPLQSFDVTDLIAGGELVEWGQIWFLSWFYLLCRALPLVLIGIYFYWRRELGLAIRK
ncbi:MAG: hypothetical protein IJJ28_00795 [Lentisphaeria bacterium]|nr:hypothetical protein [Lentisphaeria bacterium]